MKEKLKAMKRIEERVARIEQSLIKKGKLPPGIAYFGSVVNPSNITIDTLRTMLTKYNRRRRRLR